MLSTIYRLLGRFKRQDEISEDMQRTFEEARLEARGRGWGSYSMFAAREIAGLFSLPPARLWWLRAAAWGVAGAAAGWIASYALPARYTSEASLRLAPSLVSQDLLPRASTSVESLLEAESPVILSRWAITSIVNRFGLYTHMRTRMPMEEVVEEFRKSIHIERSGANLIRVAFTYGDFPAGEDDRQQAQKVVADLVGRLIDEQIRERASMSYATMAFFSDRAEALGKEWSKLNDRVEATAPSNPQYALLARSRDQKRKELEAAEQKHGEAETLLQLDARKLDRCLELMEPAMLPEQPDTSPRAIRLAGLAGGLSVWLLRELWLALRRASMDLVVARATEPV